MRFIGAPRDFKNIFLSQKKLVNRAEHPIEGKIEDNLMKIKEKMMEI